MMPRSTLLLALWVSAPAFASAQSLEEAARRELPRLARQTVKPEDGAFTASIEAAGPPVVRMQRGQYHVEVPLGDASPLHCFVGPGSADQGGTLIPSARQALSSGQLTRFQLMEVIPLGIDPLLLVDLEYALDGGAGLVKAATFSGADMSFVCLHDAVGYRQSFRRLAQQLARTLTVPAPSSQDAVRGELFVISVRDLLLGFERNRVLEGEEGDRVDERIGFTFVPQSATEAVLEDSVNVVVAEQNGEVKSGLQVKAVNGEVQLDLKYERIGQKRYHVEGKLGGKDVSADFETRAPLPGQARVEEAVRAQLAASEAKPFRAETYDPEIDLQGTVPLTLRRAEEGDRMVAITLGKLELKAHADDEGLFDRLEVASGQLPILQRRVSTLASPAQVALDDAPLADPTVASAPTPTLVTTPRDLAAAMSEDEALAQRVRQLQRRAATADVALFGGLAAGAAVIAAGFTLLPADRCGFDPFTGAQSCSYGATHLAIAGAGVAVAAGGALIGWALKVPQADWQKLVDDWNRKKPTSPLRLSGSW